MKISLFTNPKLVHVFSLSLSYMRVCFFSVFLLYVISLSLSLRPCLYISTLSFSHYVFHSLSLTRRCANPLSLSLSLSLCLCLSLMCTLSYALPFTFVSVMHAHKHTLSLCLCDNPFLSLYLFTMFYRFRLCG